LETSDRLGKIRAALVCIRLAASQSEQRIPRPIADNLREHFQLMYDGLNGMLDSSDWPSAIPASWALAWIGQANLLAALPKPEMISSLYRLWRQQESQELGRYPAWALKAQQLLPRDTFSKDTWGDCDLFLRQIITDKVSRWDNDQLAAWVVSWYRRAPWSDAELVEQLSRFITEPYYSVDPSVRRLLENLGNEGRQVLEEADRKRAEFEAAQSKQDTTTS
jgi:hypothetical protein